MLWPLAKGTKTASSVDMDYMYAGFTNGKWIAYSLHPERPGLRPTVAYQKDENQSCPSFNLTNNCAMFFEGNSTNKVTGKISGAPTSAAWYDPRLRPWYMKALANDSIWRSVIPSGVKTIQQSLLICARSFAAATFTCLAADTRLVRALVSLRPPSCGQQMEISLECSELTTIFLRSRLFLHLRI